MEPMKLPDKVTNIMSHLISHGHKVAVLGGAVRDHILGIEPHDYDIFTSCTTLLDIFPDGKVLGGEERQEKILTVIVDGIEVSSFRKSGDRTEIGKSLEQHQSTSDFTINSIACDINGEFIGDKTINSIGLIDVKNKLLRFVGDAADRVSEDKLRVLRGVRFMLKYDLEADYNAVKMLSNTNLHDLPVERIKDELIKIYSLNLKPGFLPRVTRFLPREIRDNNMYKDGGSHHAETPYQHCENSAIKAREITDDWRIVLAANLHDVAKGICMTEANESDVIYTKDTKKPILVNVTKEIHFYQHEKKGAEIVEDWMTKMKFSIADTKFVTTLVKLHMYSYKDEPSNKSYVKFFNKLEDAGIEVEDYVMLLYADHQGNMKKPRIKFGDFIKNNWLHKKYYELKHTKVPFRVHDLTIGGKDLIERYGMVPGKQIGMVLNVLFNMVMDGDLKNERAELLDSKVLKPIINGAYGKLGERK